MSKGKVVFRKQRSISHTSLTTHSRNEAISRHLSASISTDYFTINEEFQQLEHQVAGHQFIDGEDSIGLLKCKNGTILKPVSKADLGLREVNFYNHLQTTKDASLIELKKYTSNFFGTRMINVNQRKVEFIILENLLEGIAEPCVIDIKIGRQTWDPAATQDKIEREQKKYTQCKNDVGFCIPGFQVHKLSTGRLHKYNKEYGKKLNGETAVEALKIFLNSDVNGNINRKLLMQLLSILWKIQKWAKSQRAVKLYSTSLLMIYDFRVLKKYLNLETSTTNVRRVRPKSLDLRKVSFNSPEGYSGNVTSSFSGQISPTGPILTSFPAISKPLTAYDIPKSGIVDNTQSSWHRTFNSIRRSYPNSINYGDYLSRVKQDYASSLAELNGDVKKDEQWCDVKIIDFAHAYLSTDLTADTNYIEGIDNIINIFENFLRDDVKV